MSFKKIAMSVVFLSLFAFNVYSKDYFTAPVSMREELLNKFDKDKNNRISVDDFDGIKDKKFCWKVENEGKICLKGSYALSNLLQELTLADESGSKVAKIPAGNIKENPALRVSRMIKQYYWDGLTRRFDEASFAQILPDSKIDHYKSKRKWYLWVSERDAEGVLYFKKIHRKLKGKIDGVPFEIEVLPKDSKITPKFVLNLTKNNKHGALALKMEKDINGKVQGVPFVVPGGRFNEMYGWDSYFECKGLLVDGRVELCKAMVDNFIFQIEHFGKILNANRTYYLNRSQPPFLTQMALSTFEAMNKQSKTDLKENKKWLAKAIKAAIKEYNQVWTNKNDRGRYGLSTYYGKGVGLCPEVETGGYDEFLAPYAEKKGFKGKDGIRKYQKLYSTGKLKDADLDVFVTNDRAIRESGNDTTYRFDNRTADFLAVDLNSLLYRYEMDIADIIKKEFSGKFSFKNNRGKTILEKSDAWYAKADKRKKEMNARFWNEKKGMFFDFDTKSNKQSDDYMERPCKLWI